MDTRFLDEPPDDEGDEEARKLARDTHLLAMEMFRRLKRGERNPPKAQSE